MRILLPSEIAGCPTVCNRNVVQTVAMLWSSAPIIRSSWIGQRDHEDEKYKGSASSSAAIGPPPMTITTPVKQSTSERASTGSM